MKIPAIRANMGIWSYYMASLKFSEIEKCVNEVTRIHKSKQLNDLLQRSVTNNINEIVDYLEKQEERFFNSLVLAVYDGDPQWREVRLDYGGDEEYYDIGLLEFRGDEKIFPVDGQHRVEAIKKALEKNKDTLKDEQVPVIFIGHRNDVEGMKRSRRMFSTLNRYAKPVSKRDIIALDEDDIVAITSRELINSYELFSNDRILDHMTKAIPSTNKTVFTTMITLYECNLELLKYYLSTREVKSSTGSILKSPSSKVKEYIKFRPSKEELDEFLELCLSFWDSLSKNINSISLYLKNDPKRDNENLLFRPAGILPFVQAFIDICQKTGEPFEIVAQRLNQLPLNLTDSEWDGLLWDEDNKKMVMNNSAAVKLRLTYLYDEKLLTKKELENLVKGIAKAKMISPKEARKEL